MPQDFSSCHRFDDFSAVFAATRTQPRGKAFLTAGSHILTYGQAEDLTARLCGFFAEKGLRRGDRAVILSHDDIAAVTLFLSCLRFGLTAVIINPEASQEEQENLIKAARARALFADKAFLSPISSSDMVILPISPGSGHKKPGFLAKKTDRQVFPQQIYNFEPAKDLPVIPLDTVAYILFTSGTTSRPKGVEITHGNLLAQMKTFVRHYGYDARSSLLNILPLHHTDGLTQGPVVAFTAGCNVHRPFRFSMNKLQNIIDSVYKYKISHFIAVPAMLQLLDALDAGANDAFKTPDFKFVISTAGFLDPHLWERFEARFGVMVVNVYGLTETVCEALYCGPTPETRRPGSIGKPVDTECRIVGEDGRDLPDGQTGELWLKGPHIMKGYFEMPQETAEVLSPDGWLRTGDLCRRDADGFYYIAGRKKNVIIVGGMNIYPEDVASVLRRLPGILDAAVWGETDPTWGETVTAAVMPQKGVLLDPDKLGAAFLEHAALQMLPRQIHVVDELPRGPAGKVIIRDLREKIAAKSTTPVRASATTHDDLPSRIIATAARSFKCPPDVLSLESTAETTKGWNSLAHIEFLLALEKEFAIKIEPRDILSVRSLGDALRLIQGKTKKAA